MEKKLLKKNHNIVYMILLITSQNYDKYDLNDSTVLQLKYFYENLKLCFSFHY